MKKTAMKIGRINPNTIKSRDLVHLQEITHGSGAGAHKSKKDYRRRDNRKLEKNWEG